MGNSDTFRRCDCSSRRLSLWIPESDVSGVKASQLLYPFNGSPIEHDGYDLFAEHGQEIFQRTSIENADFAALPFDGNILVDTKKPSANVALTSARQIVDNAAQHRLKTIVIANTDSTRPVPLSQPDTLVLRPSILR